MLRLRYFQQIRVIYYRYINIRRRGDVGGSAKKMGMRIRELERLYGIKVGKPNYENNSQLKTQENLASDMNIDSYSPKLQPPL